MTTTTKNWFVLRVASNREDQVRDALERKVKIEKVDDLIGRILVPTERIKRVKAGQQKVAERKLYPGYVFVEILERLSEETKRPAYVELALDYARAYERLEPWTSWAYAFEARHATAGSARIRAAGIALILDPQSQWLQEVDKQTLAQGRQWATANRWPAKDVPRA